MASKEQIQADIQKVSQNRNNPETQAYIQKNFGGTVDDYIKNQTARLQGGGGGAQSGGTPRHADPAMAQLEQYLRSMTDGFVKNQQAGLESHLNASVAELRAQLEQAIAEGSISVRDAEAQFAEQSKMIQQEAYQNAERTSAHAQDRGLQNSQQAQGMMRTDDARKTTMINENMTTRDKRVNDIRDRLNAVKAQTQIGIDRAQADFRTGMIGAQGQAEQMFGQGMFGLKSDELSDNRKQGFTEKNMAIQQGYNRENLETEFQNHLKKATHESNLAIERMNIQQGFDIQKLGIQFANDLKKIGVMNANEIKNARDRVAETLKIEEARFQRQLRLIDPNTREGKLQIEALERESKQNIMNAMQATATEAYVMKVMNEAPSSAPKAPFDHKKGHEVNNPMGSLLNWLSGYNKNLKKYNTEQEMWNAMQRIMETGKGNTPGW